MPEEYLSPGIQTENLTRLFGKLVAVDSLNLSIKTGELFALLGPNGAGKSTTINMLSCLLKPSSGTARVLGYDINNQPYDIKKILGTSPQETTLSEHLTPIENLYLIGKVHGIDQNVLDKWVPAAMEAMGLSERAKDQVRTFSGGMRRRLSIMMALIHDPKVVFLDEPTLGLDPQSRRAMWEYIGALKGDKTILLTTHYMEEAEVLADRIGIMDGGRLIALGTSQDLKSQTLDKRTVIVNAWNLSLRGVEELSHRYRELRTEGGNLTITGERLDLKEIVDNVAFQGAIIRSARFKEPSLEDVYLRLTGKELREGN